MKSLKQTVTLTLVLCLCLTMLAGCRRRNDNTITPTPTVEPTQQVTTEHAMGIISYVGDSYIAVTEYTTDKEITDFADLDTDSLTASDNTRYISVTDNTAYFSAVGAGRDKITKSDLSVGDFITAATVDGALQITRLGTTDNEEMQDAPTDKENQPATSPNP